MKLHHTGHILFREVLELGYTICTRVNYRLGPDMKVLKFFNNTLLPILWEDSLTTKVVIIPVCTQIFSRSKRYCIFSHLHFHVVQLHTDMS